MIGFGISPAPDQSKHKGRLGPEEFDLQELRILSRVVTRNSRGITYEAGQRHVEICLPGVGPTDHSKTISTPTDRSAKDYRNWKPLVNSEVDSELLSPSAATKYKGIVASMKYLGQDKSEIQFAVKE